jgi:hypothetical protein
MKIQISLAISPLAFLSADGFSTKVANSRSRFVSGPLLVGTASEISSEINSDFGSGVPEPVSPYGKIGICEEELALGVNPEECANFIGTYVYIGILV